MKLPCRINTWVPFKTKARIASVAKRTGLKTSDVIRISLKLALDHFEKGSVQLTSLTPTRQRQP